MYLHFVSDLSMKWSLSVHNLSGENIDKGGFSIAELDIRK